ncbi:MAG: hypothetical protein QOJ01_1605 [Solirubrobacterales bacterium]|nr:hypothetical protein [Solirubrobacterales bacterium]
MEGERGILSKAWHLPLAVSVLTVPIIAATFLGGPPAGLGAAFLAASGVVILAARARPEEPIEGSGPGAGRLLVLACSPVDEPSAVAPITAAARELSSSAPEILVVSPASTSRLAGWTSDLHAGRLAAADRLVLTLAGLAAAGLDARSRVGDADPVLATEDAIRSWPAEMIVFFTDRDDERGARAARDVSRRATIPVRHVVLDHAAVGHA